MNGLQIPINGVCFLVTSEDTPRQLAHTDFNWGKHGHVGWNPSRGYFVMVSGAMPFKLVAWLGSHLFVSHENEKTAVRICRTLPFQMVVVPQYSIFIGRGDLVHAGAAYVDDEDLLKETFGGRWAFISEKDILRGKFGGHWPYSQKIRIHVYVAESQSSFPASVFTVSECKVSSSS